MELAALNTVYYCLLVGMVFVFIRDGLVKMQECYRDNPKMGDVHQVEAQMLRNSDELDKLTAELRKFQVRR